MTPEPDSKEWWRAVAQELGVKCQQAERERDAFKGEAMAASCTTAGTSLMAQLQQAEAHLEMERKYRWDFEATTRRLEKELALAEQEREAWMKEWSRKGDRADKAKAEARRLREALEAVKADVPLLPDWARAIIDAALAATPEGPS